MKISTRLFFIAVLALTCRLHAEADQPVYPSSDNRILDRDGDGTGDETFADDNEKEVLNVGDNSGDQIWRSVVKFDVSDRKEEIADASKVELMLTVRQRLIQIPREWDFEVVSFESATAGSVTVGEEGDFSARGRTVYEVKAGTVKSGGVVTVDVTEAAKTAAKAEGVLALRLQLNPATNNDRTEDQISFYSGSHGVNSPRLRPQLRIHTLP